MEWKWISEPPILKNNINHYHAKLSKEKVEFNSEVKWWIEEGILTPWDQDVQMGVLPLMAVEQPTKNKITPVLNYRELNKCIMCYSGGDAIDVCGEIMRKWRQMTTASKIVDLRSTYLQIHVTRHLWKYQLVQYKGQTYCLTRLGFQLNALKIMSKILKTVLKKRNTSEKTQIRILTTYWWMKQRYHWQTL